MSNNNIPFRSSRDRLIELAPHLIPNPLPDLPVVPINFRPILSTDDLVVGSVEKGEKAMIYVDESQRGVVYQLRTKAGTDVGEPIDGNCERIGFETEVLTADEWYEFYILATRPSTQVSKVLNTRIWINAGNIDGVDPSPLTATPRWEATYTVVIPDTQPNLEWQLFHENGDPASDPVDSTVVNSSDNSTTTTTTITLVSYPLYENEALRIHVRNEITEEAKNLSQTPEIKVYPNPNLGFFNNGTPLNPRWNTPVQVKINFPQSTVRYQLMQQVGPDLLPSGPAEMGMGTELILTSAPLLDIATLRVLAVKVDGNLPEYLHGDLEVVVYPDPTIVARLAEELIDYGATVMVDLPAPQPDTQYYLHLGDGVPVGPAVLSDGSPVRLGSPALMEDQALYIRAERRNLSTDLDTVLTVYVRPNLGLDVELPHTTFERSDGTHILVHNTQESVSYVLFKQPGDWDQWADRIECSRARGNGETLALPTGELGADKYTFFVVAEKSHPLSFGELRESIYLEVSLRLDTPVRGGTDVLDYGRTTTLEVLSRQTCVNYTPVSGARLLGNMLDFQAPNAPMPTFPLLEDTILQVQAIHCLTMETVVLDFTFPVEVGPKLDIEVTAPEPHVPFEEQVFLHFDDGQASVTYELRGEADFYTSPVPDGFTQYFSPEQDGPFVVPFGPLTFPMRIMVVARKTVNQMADALWNQVSVAPYPDRGQEVRVIRHPEFYGDTADIEVVATDWHTNYALKLRDTTSVGSNAATTSPATLTLTTHVREEDTTVYVCATSLVPQIGISLRQRAAVWVPPNLNLVPVLHRWPFQPWRGALIRIPDSQRSAQYRLEISSGDQGGFHQTVLLNRRANGGGDTILRTPPLGSGRYRIRVLAEKHPSGQSGFMHSAVEFYVGTITNNQLAAASTVIAYRSRAEITIMDAQPMAEYQLFSQQGRPLSDPVATSDRVMHLAIPSYPLEEDQDIQVRVTNLLTEQDDFLDHTVVIRVLPNENLNPSIVNPIIAYNGMVRIQLTGAQRSVRYVLLNGITNDPGAENPPAVGSVLSTAQPQEDGDHELSFGPFQHDQEFTLKAVKANSQLEIVLPEVYQVQVYPDHDLEISVSRRVTTPDEPVRIQLPRSQRGVRYRLRDRTAPPGEGFASQEGFNHFNQPESVARIEDDLGIRNDGTGVITLYTDPTDQAVMQLEIWARKDHNGLEAVLHEPINIEIQGR